MVIYFCFLLSGISGLIYEVLWAKYFALIFGSTAYAHTLVLSTFMAGLALGSFFLGRLADRVKEQLILYAWIEIAIALFCVFTPRFFVLLEGVYLYASASFGFNALGILVIKFILGALIMLIPTVLMGGTLPILSKYLIRSLAVRGQMVARLYYVNSFGAVLGTLLAGFYLIYNFGLEFSITVAALINFSAGVIALVSRKFIAKRSVGPAIKHNEFSVSDGINDKKIIYSSKIIRISIIAIFLSGIVAMLYELVWIRLLSLVLGSSTYSFSLMLAAFISGITIGSFLISKIMPKERFTFLYFGLCEAGVALCVIFTIPFYERLPFFFLNIYTIFAKTPETFALFEITKFLFCFLVMLPPTIFLGMTLPLVSKIVSYKSSLLGKKIGSVFAANTLGNILGALISGLLLIPILGLRQTLEVGIIINLILGSIIFLTERAISIKYKWVIISFCFLCFSGYKLFLPEWNKTCFTAQAFRGYNVPDKNTFADFLKMTKKGKILFYQDGLDATVAVSDIEDKSLSLYVNGKADASTGSDMPTQILSAQLPLLLKPDAQDALVIGLGSGVTCGSALRHPLGNLDVVEISPSVVEANKYFAEFNYHALKDKRLHLYIEDAKTFIKRTEKKYDLIISEPSNPWLSGVGNLFSVEFFKDCLSRLKEDGLMAQWVQAYEIDDDTLKIVLGTFHAVFPEVTVWHPGGNDIIMLGSEKRIIPNFKLAEEAMNLKAIKDDLSRIELGDLSTLLSLQLSSSRNLDAIVLKGGVINSDYYPVLEYSAPRALYLHAMPAALLSKLDERKFALNRTGLILSGYLQNHKMDNNNFRNLYTYFNKYTSFYKNELLNSLARRWIKDYPKDDMANFVFDYNYIGSLQNQIGSLKKLIRRNNKFEYLNKYADLQILRYLSSRSFIFPEVFNEAVDGLKLCIRLSGDKQAHFYYLLGRLYFENMDYRKVIDCYAKFEESISSKEDAQTKGIDYRRVLIDLGIAYCSERNLVKGFEYFNKARALK
ncbi:MAG: fused MFS/spermidine synthase [Candidatus Omnitrophota bacterium]